MTKLKRNTPITVKETGQQLYVERDRGDGRILCRDTPKDNIAAAYFDLRVDSIEVEPKRYRTSQIKAKPKSKERLTFDQELSAFFRQVTLRMPTKCQECGSQLFAFNNFGRRSCAAHILPKAKFKSVAMNEDNIVYLGADFLGGCSCHDEMDKLGVEHRVKMKIYPLVLERFEKLKPNLTQRELIQAYTYLGISWQ